MYVTSELLFFNSSLLDKKYNLFLFEVTFPLFGLTRAQLRRFTIVASTDVANSSLHRTGWRRMDEATRETPSGVKRKAVRRRLLLRVTWQSTLELILGRSPTDVIMTGVEKCTLQHIIWRFVSIKIYFCYPDTRVTVSSVLSIVLWCSQRWLQQLYLRQRCLETTRLGLNDILQNSSYNVKFIIKKLVSVV